MNITLSLPPEQQAALEERAAASGTDLPTFLRQVVEQSLAERTERESPHLSSEQWLREFRDWVASRPSRNPRFDDSRESIYN